MRCKENHSFESVHHVDLIRPFRDRVSAPEPKSNEEVQEMAKRIGEKIAKQAIREAKKLTKAVLK